MDHFESFNLITIRKKGRRAYTRLKEVEFNDKIEFLGASWAEDFVCLMEFPREWPGKLPIRAQPYTAMVSGSLTYLRARKRRFSDSMARLTFSTQRYTVETRMGNHFSDEKCYHAIEPRLLIARSTATKFQLNLRRKIECRYERKSEWNTFSSCDPSMQKLSHIPWKFFAIYRTRVFF